ncbi:ribonuclease P protein subunit p40-like [Condylostylus longicornis]|uniref:ribonuclease P protein subunit p40-like n=1 Tax=Condylostylus longicornis TaxID=2530218 RepID=UPI00244DB0C7|nr:ribonuclease P protein subunit p40-like [Condylostylus longicornis]
MLCPEVWKFDYPKNNMFLEIGRLSKKSDQFLEKLICKHPFNQTFSVVIAEENSDNIPEKILSHLNGSFYYIVNDIKLTDLIRKDFIEAFVKRGKFTALNLVEFNEIDDIFAVRPDGKLILIINKDLYQSIGLDGRVHSSFTRRKDRFGKYKEISIFKH